MCNKIQHPPALAGSASGHKKEAAASALMQQPPGGAPLGSFCFQCLFHTVCQVNEFLHR